jgi:hypothetical protein
MLKPNQLLSARTKALPTWRIYSQWAGHASYLGVVSAPNPRTAIERAIQEFQITSPEHRKRLVAELGE